MIASGADRATASPIPAASRPSTTIAFAPSLRMASADFSFVAVPVTTWPRATSIGTSRFPMAPPAPATKTRIGGPPFSSTPPRRDGGRPRETSLWRRHGSGGERRRRAPEVASRRPVDADPDQRTIAAGDLALLVVHSDVKDLAARRNRGVDALQHRLLERRIHREPAERLDDAGDRAARSILAARREWLARAGDRRRRADRPVVAPG